MDLNGSVQGSHGGELKDFAVIEGRGANLGREVAIQVRHGDGDSLARELAKVNDLVAPFCHLETAFSIHRQRVTCVA